MTAACAKLICILKIVFACDVCLNWYYLRCIGLRFAPKKPTGVAEIASDNFKHY
jgi:hypothetical protein